MGFPGGASGSANAGDTRDSGLVPGSEGSPWRRAWRPTPVFLPGESHGQRNLAGYSPWDCKELDMTERLTLLLLNILPHLPPSWTDLFVGKGVEDNSHLPDREPIDIIVIESYLVEGKIFFWSM